jgi:hypothetical protein
MTGGASPVRSAPKRRGGLDCQPALARFIACGMSDADKKARLAEALRANLRKRKAQSREQVSREQDSQTGAHLPSSHDRSSPSS